MKVHHLNCATFEFPPQPIAALTGQNLVPSHVLLIETSDSLVLVDSGYGLDCVRRPREILGLMRLGARLTEQEAAVRQIEALGFSPTDVRHIILTHLDLDHAGGLADFPWATVHVHGPEYRAAMKPATMNERMRYRSAEWAHNPKWAVNEADGGEQWFGFDAVRDLPGLPSEILAVPLYGHTRGHAGVAVDTGDGWLLHAGDSFLAGHEIHPQDPRSTAITRAYDIFGTTKRGPRQANLARLIELNADHGSEISIFCSHDMKAFNRLAGV